MKRRDVKKWLIGLSDPVDPGILLEMLDVFARASGAIAHDGGLTVADIMLAEEGKEKLKNSPLARGMQAVNKALADRGTLATQGYLARIGTIGQIVTREDLFGDFMDPPDPETGNRMVTESLIRAAAVARFKIGMKQVGYDLEDVREKALDFEAIDAEVQNPMEPA
jgi:hypothetical protein